MLRALLVAGLSCLLLLTAQTRQAAAEGVVCPDGSFFEGVMLTCVLAVSSPGAGGGGPQVGQGAVIDSGGTVSACIRDVKNEPVPCESASGWWSNERQCYVQLMDPQPAPGHVLWEGRTDGAIYLCTFDYGFAVLPLPFWSDSMPAGPAAPVDPAVVAQTIVNQMELRAITIGMVPEDTPGSMGVVGLPAWLWVDAPSEQTFGPMTRSASLGGVSVTATARVTKVLWEMGDGGAVTCTSPGTPFSDGHGGQQSPDCGYTYARQGTYTIRATSYWSVDWTSTSGPSGSIPLQFTQSRILQVGEIQVVRT